MQKTSIPKLISKKNESFSEFDQKMMREAILLAKLAEIKGEVPVGAVLVCEDKIIGKGFNQPISGFDPTLHAEIVALKEAAKQNRNYRLPNTTLYVTLEPCCMCVGAMLHARIKRLVFGAFDPKSGSVESVARLLDIAILNHRITYNGGLLQYECGEILRNFFRKRR